MSPNSHENGMKFIDSLHNFHFCRVYRYAQDYDFFQKARILKNIYSDINFRVHLSSLSEVQDKNMHEFIDLDDNL